MASGIKLSLTGFDELLTKIEKAGGSINSATEKCLKVSADIMQSELKNQMQKAGVSNALISRMPAYEIEQEKNSFSCVVGYPKGDYNVNNLTDGYKVVFLNYGTPARQVSERGIKHFFGEWVTFGKNRGKLPALGFIQKAKAKAKAPIKKAQEETLHEILRELEQ